MKITAHSALEHFLYDAIVQTNKEKRDFADAERNFYNSDKSHITEKATHLKYAKERFEAASIRLYELLTAQKVIKELEKRYRSLKSIIMEIKNGIIIDGVLHDLIRTEYHDCKTCSLCSICYKNLLIDKLCDIKVQKGISYKFVNQGKVTNIKIDKED